MYLSQSTLKSYATTPIEWGFGDLSEFIMHSKYSRSKDQIVDELNFSDSNKEEWWEVVARNVEGLFRLMKQHIPRHRYKRSEIASITRSMYDDMFNFRFLPAGRPLHNIGTYIVEKKGLGASLNNCSFVTFDDKDPINAFRFILDYSMLGVGVGVHIFNTDHKIYKTRRGTTIFIVPDSREGWVKGLEMLLYSHLNSKQKNIRFDYSDIRAEGTPIKGMGGLHAGYKPLEEMFEGIREILTEHDTLCTRALADITNIIGRGVVNGGQRRTALILLGNKEDEVFLNLKNYEKYPYRFDRKFAWFSNNSVLKNDLDELDYEKIEKQIVEDGTGEPAIIFMNNRKYGRMANRPDFIDQRARGVNPCAEMFLEPYEMCNLMELNINKILTGRNLFRSIYNAVLFAKIISHVPSHWDETNEVVGRNHRIGISLTGIVEYMSRTRISKLQFTRLLDKLYDMVHKADRAITAKLRTSLSIRTTTIKPSGTMSLLMGTTAGIHGAWSEFNIRRVETPKNSGYGEYYSNKGYDVEDSVYKDNVEVISFPLHFPEIRTVEDQTIEEQFKLAALLQKHWSDNSVSVSISYKEDEGNKIAKLLKKHEDELKSVSFVKYDNTFYKQLPIEKIEQGHFEELALVIEAHLGMEDEELPTVDSDAIVGCTNDSCEMPHKDLNKKE